MADLSNNQQANLSDSKEANEEKVPQVQPAVPAPPALKPEAEASPETQALPVNEAGNPEIAEEEPAQPEVEAPTEAPKNIEAEQAPEPAPSLEQPKQHPQPKADEPLAPEPPAPVSALPATSQPVQPVQPVIPPAPANVAAPLNREEVLPTKPKAENPRPTAERIPFITEFKNKLFELRKKANQKRFEKVEKNLEKIMQYAKEKQKITNDDVERITGVKDDQATNYLNILVKQGKLTRFGKKKNIFYKPIKR